MSSLNNFYPSMSTTTATASTTTPATSKSSDFATQASTTTSAAATHQIHRSISNHQQMPPILKMVKQNQLNANTKNKSKSLQNIFNSVPLTSSPSTRLVRPSSILSSLNDVEKRYNRQQKLLKEQLQSINAKSLEINANNEMLVEAAITNSNANFQSENSAISGEESNANVLTTNKLTLSSLANAFPSFYLNPNETNYTKLINSILNNKIKTSMAVTASSQKTNMRSINENDEFFLTKPFRRESKFKLERNNSFALLEITQSQLNIQQTGSSDVNYRLSSNFRKEDFRKASLTTSTTTTPNAAASSTPQANSTSIIIPTDTQKREQLSAKLSYTLSNPLAPSSTAVHVNQLALDANANGAVRFNLRNKSANMEHSQQHYNHVYNNNNNNSATIKPANVQTSQQQTNTNLNNASLSNHLLNAQSFRIQNSLTKNFIDFNNIQQNEKMFHLAATTANTNNSSNTTPLITNNNSRISSARNNSSIKIINDSNKFLEDILAHSKRNNSKLLIQNQPVNGSKDLTTPPIGSLNASIQLPSNVTIIYRSADERATFPDKLILERKNLTICPIIEGETDLKLINYQHNQIKFIQNLDTMTNLIFLDLYDNCIERIIGISNLVNLRVLMLGKNRIKKIENLNNLVYLDILDLHGNQITHIENLNNLHELRVLNMAANQIKVADNFNGLYSLVELNLRRNQIEKINDLDSCTKLQRLFLSYNEIQNLTDINNIHGIISLQELTLDNNPLASSRNYKRNIIGQLLSLKSFDSKRLNDEEKRIAEKAFIKEEYRRRDLENLAFVEERRRLTIRDAENQWSLQQQQNNNRKLRANTYNDLRIESINNSDANSGGETPTYTKNKNPLSSCQTIDSTVAGSNNSDSLNSKSTENINTTSPSSSSNNVDTNNNKFETTGKGNGNDMKINSKLKIVSLRNPSNKNLISINNANSSSNDTSLLNANNANNSMSSSSSSSLLSNENNKTGNKNNECIEDVNQKQSNSRTNSASSSVRTTNNKSYTSSNTASIPSTTTIINQTPANNKPKSLALNGGSNIHEDNTLFFYGSKSMDILEQKLDMSITSQVYTVSFHFIDYDECLIKNFARIRQKFPNVNSLIFTCCNLKTLNQLDYLSEWKKLDALTINKEDNPVYLISIWRSYVFHRLNSLQIKKLNNQPITLDDFKNSTKLFTPILNSALNLPEYKLIAILGQEKKKLIKLAKEKLNDPNSSPTPEQLLARDSITKAVFSYNISLSNKQRISSNSGNTNIHGNNHRDDATSKQAASHHDQGKHLLNNMISQMNYNDLKKQKIKQTKQIIWSQFINNSVQSINDPQTHVMNLCKKHKIVL